MEFLNLQPTAFGIDISDLSIKIVKLRKKGRFFDLVSFGETAIKPGVIEKGEIKNEEELAKIIKTAVGQAKGEKLKTKYVIASLPEEKAFLQVIQLPIMKKEEVEKAVYFEAENYIPIPLEKVYLGSQIVPPVVDHLDHVDVLIAALPQKIVDDYLAVLKKAGLRPLALEIESQAVPRVLIENGMSKKPVLLMDLGISNTSFIIFSGYSLRFTSSCPISSQTLTEAIAKNFKVDLKKAEELKNKHGVAGNDKNNKILKVLAPILNDLLNQIEKYFDYYQTHTSHEHLPDNSKQVSKIILFGGGANLKGLPDFLSLNLNLPVECGNPWLNILPKPSKGLTELSQKEALKYVTAIGLAMRNTEL
jgi:type IV pilus assembly protein PilM